MPETAAHHITEQSPPEVKHTVADEKGASYPDEKANLATPDAYSPNNYLADGTERPIETAEDIATR